MNQHFYRSLMLTRIFFHTFRHVRYRHVPVARAMVYAFHRNAMRRYGRSGSMPVRRIAIGKRRLYRQLIRPDGVRKLAYRHSRKKPAKIIYSPLSIQGMRTSRKHTLILGQSKNERRQAGRARGQYVVPSQMTRLNVKAYRKLLRQIYRITRQRKVYRYFKTRAFKRWIAAQLRATIRMIDGINQTFAKHRVTGIVLHSSVHPLGYLLVHMGRQRGVPTFITQYGINDDYQLFSTYAQHYIAWGPFHRKRLTALGVPANKFRLLGNARFDSVFSRRWGNKRSLARRLRFSPRKWVFVYPEQPLPVAKNRKVLLAIIRSLAPYRRRVVLLVKPHPRQRRMSVSSRILRRYRFVKMVRGRRVHLYHMIRHANAVFVQFSTVGIEAMLHNRPLISIVFYKNTSKHEFTYYGASRHITSPRNPRQLSRVVKLFMSSAPYRRKILRLQRHYRRGTYTGNLAARRIQRFIASRSRK